MTARRAAARVTKADDLITDECRQTFAAAFRRIAAPVADGSTHQQGEDD